MPLFRRPISKAAANYVKARNANKTQRIEGSDGRFLFDIEGSQKEFNAKNKLDKLIKLRTKGPVGGLRKLLAPKAVARLKRLQKYQADREEFKKNYTKVLVDLHNRGFEVKQVKNVQAKRNLAAVHSLLKEISTGDKIEATSLRGNHYYGEVVDAVGPFLFIRTEGETELTHLKLSKLKEVNKIKE
jgi:hypothetical protein